jgi:prepilin signal peptidase PulO-like enzyme (type II secretory pathway)
MTIDLPGTSWLGTPAAARLLAVVAAAVWGAIFGSFMNVVVHRLPRGESPFTGRSRCPRCQTEILARDNIPVVGWLLRGGRCRGCARQISAMYPLVEAGCGLLCGSLAAAHASRGDIDRLIVFAEWWPLVAWAVEAVAILVIVTWALLEARGWPTCPGAWPLAAAFAVIAAAVPQAGPPGLLPDGRPWPAADPPLAGGLAACVGFLAGRAAGSFIGTATGRSGLAMLGAVTGWQAVTVVAVVTAVVSGLTGTPSGRGGQTTRRRTIATANMILTIAAAAALAAGKAVLHAVTAAGGRL